MTTNRRSLLLSLVASPLSLLRRKAKPEPSFKDMGIATARSIEKAYGLPEGILTINEARMLSR